MTQLTAVLVTIQITDHPHSDKTHLVGVFDWDNTKLINMMGEIGQAFAGCRCVFHHEKIELNEVLQRRWAGK